MVGKTNLTFISKGEGSNVQLIQKSYATDATNEIYKMEYINEKFFVYVDPNTVMTGSNMKDMEFVKKDGQYLRATHVIQKNGKYFILCANEVCQIYATGDFITYELLDLGETIAEESGLGIFLDDKERVVLVTYNSDEHMLIRVCEATEALKNEECVDAGKIKDVSSKVYMRDNKIFRQQQDVVFGRYEDVLYITSLNGNRKHSNHQLGFYDYAGGYFFYYEVVSSSIDGKYLYRSRDGIDFTRYASSMGVYHENVSVIPICSQFGYIYMEKNLYYLNITDDILKVGNSENDTMPIFDRIDICSVLECDGRTYLGTDNGNIYELQLDYEGIIQRPDVSIIKTMSAREALSKSIQYTDYYIKDLRQYVNDKIQETLSANQENSTHVESMENVD